MDSGGSVHGNEDKGAEKSMDDYLKSIGLHRKKIAKDGSCLFRAVAEQVMHSQSFHTKVRAECVEFLKENRESYEAFIEGDFEDYLLKLQDPQQWVGEVEINALAVMYKRDFLIFQEPGKPAVNITDKDFKDQVQLCFLNGNHYDSVYPISHIKNAALCQSILYELLYDGVFKVDRSSLGSCQRISRPSDLLSDDNMNACVSSDESDLDASDTLWVENETSATASRPNSYKGRGRGRLLPERVRRSLNPTLFRNVEFDVWHKTKRAQQKMDYCIAAGMQFAVGDRCQVRLEGRSYSATVREVSANNGPVWVYVEDLGTRKQVPLWSLRPPSEGTTWSTVVNRDKKLSNGHGEWETRGRGRGKHLPASSSSSVPLATPPGSSGRVQKQHSWPMQATVEEQVSRKSVSSVDAAFGLSKEWRLAREEEERNVALVEIQLRDELSFPALGVGLQGDGGRRKGGEKKRNQRNKMSPVEDARTPSPSAGERPKSSTPPPPSTTTTPAPAASTAASTATPSRSKPAAAPPTDYNQPSWLSSIKAPAPNITSYASAVTPPSPPPASIKAPSPAPPSIPSSATLLLTPALPSASPPAPKPSSSPPPSTSLPPPTFIAPIAPSPAAAQGFLPASSLPRCSTPPSSSSSSLIHPAAPPPSAQSSLSNTGGPHTPQNQNQTPLPQNQTPLPQNQTPLPQNQTPLPQDQTPHNQNQTPHNQNQTPHNQNQTPHNQNQTPLPHNQTPMSQTPMSQTPMSQTPMSQNQISQNQAPFPQIQPPLTQDHISQNQAPFPQIQPPLTQDHISQNQAPFPQIQPPLTQDHISQNQVPMPQNQISQNQAPFPQIQPPMSQDHMSQNQAPMSQDQAPLPQIHPQVSLIQTSSSPVSLTHIENQTQFFPPPLQHQSQTQYSSQTQSEAVHPSLPLSTPQAEGPVPPESAVQTAPPPLHPFLHQSVPLQQLSQLYQDPLYPGFPRDNKGDMAPPPPFCSSQSGDDLPQDLNILKFFFNLGVKAYSMPMFPPYLYLLPLQQAHTMHPKLPSRSPSPTPHYPPPRHQEAYPPPQYPPTSAPVPPQYDHQALLAEPPRPADPSFSQAGYPVTQPPPHRVSWQQHPPPRNTGFSVGYPSPASSYRAPPHLSQGYHPGQGQGHMLYTQYPPSSLGYQSSPTPEELQVSQAPMEQRKTTNGDVMAGQDAGRVPGPLESLANANRPAVAPNYAHMKEQGDALSRAVLLVDPPFDNKPIIKVVLNPEAKDVSMTTMKPSGSVGSPLPYDVISKVVAPGDNPSRGYRGHRKALHPANSRYAPPEPGQMGYLATVATESLSVGCSTEDDWDEAAGFKPATSNHRGQRRNQRGGGGGRGRGGYDPGRGGNRRRHGGEQGAGLNYIQFNSTYRGRGW